MPEVSVILPTYNAETYLDAALESILDQTHDRYEVLLVDGGSTDRTIDIAEAVGDERLRILHQESSGLPQALNEGIQAADGVYIARQDADDISKPTRLEKQARFLEAHPEVALVGTAAELIDQTGTVTDRRRVPLSPTIDDLLAENHFVHGSVMMQREYVQQLGGYDELFEYTEDYDLWLRLAEHHPVANLDEFLYQLRLRPGSIYGGALREVRLWEWFARKRFLGELDSSVVDSIERNGIGELYGHLDQSERAEFHTSMGRELLRYHEFSRARTELRKAFDYGSFRLAAAMYVLTFLPPAVEDVVESVYRWFRNRSIRPGVD